MEDDKIKKLNRVEFFIEDLEKNIVGDLSLLSIVKSPAIQENTQFFKPIDLKKQFSEVKLNIPTQHMIGPAMCANKDILRQNPITGEYFYCYFSEETVKKCAELFLKNNIQNQTSLEHGEIAGKNQLKDINCAQSWYVVDPNCDQSKALGFTSNKGDWYVDLHIQDTEMYNLIKDNFNGFSIEGQFVEQFSSLFTKSERPVEDILKDILYSETLSDEEKVKKVDNFIKNHI